MDLPDGTVSPLSGIRVLEIGTVITAPLAARLLAEFGAEVVKIERQEGGDTFRSFLIGPHSPLFQAYNKSKKSVVLDLKTQDGLDAFRTLIKTADVLLENFRPGVLERMGFTWETLSSENPRLIHCSITGFGKDGPYSKRPSFDTVALALSGIAASQLEPDNARFTGPTISDNITGMYAAMGILSALYERQQTGKGRRIEVNMLEASIAFIPDHFANYLAGLQLAPNSRAALSQCYAATCKDGMLLAIHLSSQNKFWDGLLKVIDRPDLKEDARFGTRTDRYRNYDALAQILAESFRSRQRHEWMILLENADVPFAPVYTVAECLDDAQARHLGTFHENTSQDGSVATSIRSPVWLDGKRLKHPTPAPKLGEHNAAVIGDMSRK